MSNRTLVGIMSVIWLIFAFIGIYMKEDDIVIAGIIIANIHMVPLMLIRKET